MNKTTPEHIFVLEDTDSLREVICAVLTAEGYRVSSAASAEEALPLLARESAGLALVDLKLPGKSGLDFLQELKKINSAIPVVVMTAYGSIEIAVQAMKFGAIDFITKPFDPPMLCSLIAQVFKHHRIIDREGVRSRRKREFLTQDDKTQEVLRQSQKVASLQSPVLLLGESGTGKELVAHYIHEQSLRANKEFVGVNCGSVPLGILESEFFGHEAGAFTGATEKRIGLFEVADQGTIFLDEICNMPFPLQVKLLRTLQESEIKRLGSNETLRIDTMVISATNLDLVDEIGKGNFREDLYYRLSVVVIEIPPLRERKDDIALLANYFIKSFAAQFEKAVSILTPEALKILEGYHWPGNVRELENVIERVMVFGDGPITAESLKLNLSKVPEGESFQKDLFFISGQASRQAETELIGKVLNEVKGNKSKAAKILGISYKTLLSKIKEYRLQSTN